VIGVLGVIAVAGGACTGSFPAGVGVDGWIVQPEPGSNGIPPYMGTELPYVGIEFPAVPHAAHPPPIGAPCIIALPES
jgi:hypothetical protein